MLSLLHRRVVSQLPSSRANRYFSEAVSVGTDSVASTSVIPPATRRRNPSYFIPRNKGGNLPVYTDNRQKAGHLILIRNVEGNLGILRNELYSSLFEKDTLEASRLKIDINKSKHIVISGGQWKNNVLEWVKERGF